LGYIFSSLLDLVHEMRLAPRKVKIVKPRKKRRIGTPFPESEKQGIDGG